MMGLQDAHKLHVYHKGKVLKNWEHGPWCSDERFRKVEGAGLELSRLLTPKDRFSQCFFPGVCEDRGLRAPGDTDDAACARWLASRKGFKGSNNKGQLVRDCEWLGAPARFGDLLDGWTDKWMDLAYMGIMVGEVRRSWEIFAIAEANQHARLKAAIDSVASVVNAAEAPAGGAAGANQHAANAPDGHITRAKLKSMQVVKQGLPHIIEMYSDHELKKSITRVVHAMKPSQLEHNLLMKCLKDSPTPGAHTKHLYSQWADRSWMRQVANIFQVLADPNQLQRMHMTMGIGLVASRRLALDAPVVQVENADAVEIFSLVWHQVVNHILLGAMYSWLYPAKLAGLCHKKESVRMKFRRYVLKDIANYRLAESQNDTDITSECQTQYWCTGGGQMVMTIFEHGGNWALLILEQFLSSVFSCGPGSSTINENDNRLCREEELRKRSSKKQSLLKVWTHPIYHKLSQQYGWHDIEPQTDLPKPKQPSEECFKAMHSGSIKDERGPLNQMDFTHITDEPDWARTKPQTMLNKVATAITHQVMASSGEWVADHFFKVDFLPTGGACQILRDNLSMETFMVVKAFDSKAALTVNVTLGSDMCFVMPTRREDVVVKWRTVTDLDSIVVVNSKVVSPIDIRARAYHPPFSASGPAAKAAIYSDIYLRLRFILVYQQGGTSHQPLPDTSHCQPPATSSHEQPAGKHRNLRCFAAPS